jgi:hypothetical protein
MKLLATPEEGVHLYVCGPKGFMDAVLATARAKGWPESQLHYEFFAAAPVKSLDDESFQVKLASSGRIVVVAKDTSVTMRCEKPASRFDLLRAGAFAELPHPGARGGAGSQGLVPVTR